MRKNLPVSQREFPFPDGVTLVSVTDLKGRITYCNNAFVDVSGYARDELMGQPHNLVRHPDMPEEAFRDLWATIQAGLPWTGLVKNRRKNGDHYWVRAHATPIRDDERIVGYLSVRSKPARQAVEAATAVYERLHAETAAGSTRTGLRHGKVVRRDALGRLRARIRVGTRGQIALAIGGTAAIAVTSAVTLPLAVAATIAAGAVLLASLHVHRVTLAPLARVVNDANRLASCDLTHDPAAGDDGAVGHLQQALMQMTVNLRTVIADISAETANLRHAAQEIASGNQDLSSRTEAQASSLEQTAASMEQINAAIQQSAEAANESARYATDTTEIARRSNESVDALAGAMHEIQDSSARIGVILHVVEGVAFQTNMLALNAAVEAARAGAQGRGFAVVASEVRALAQRTTAAAREIKQLINEATTRVDAGETHASEASTRMGDALAAAANVSKLLRDISGSAAELRSGVAQVNDAVTHLDGITQQNAAMVEQLAATAATVSERVQSVCDTIGLFRLGGGTLGPAQVDAVALRRAARDARQERNAPFSRALQG